MMFNDAIPHVSYLQDSEMAPLLCRYIYFDLSLDIKPPVLEHCHNTLLVPVPAG